jgi:transposase
MGRDPADRCGSSQSVTTPFFSKWPERIPGHRGPYDKQRNWEKMDHPIALTAGVDISKDHLDVGLYPGGAAKRFANDAKGHRALIGWLTPSQIARVVFEATGAYHRAFERSLALAGLPMAKVNPRQARRFAEAAGKLAKTDRLDAAMLARFGALLQPAVRPIVSETLADMKELWVARNALVKDRTAALNRQKQLRSALLRRQSSQRLKQIDTQLKAIDAALETLSGSDPDLKARFDILISIPGISTTTAFAILIEMPELGALEEGQVASLAGLAPMTRDSGQWKGKRSIRGGRAGVRRALYMPALVAIRFNTDLRAKYQALRAAGKAPKVAITAIMRKLLILANALLRDRRQWSPRSA